jgi:hypothetical protein
VLHRGAHIHQLRKVEVTGKLIDSSTAFLFEIPAEFGLHGPRLSSRNRVNHRRTRHSPVASLMLLRAFRFPLELLRPIFIFV